MLYKNCRLMIDEQILGDMWLETRDGKILGHGPMEICPAAAPSQREIDLEGRLVVPGFLDQHIHGAGGYDFMDGTQEAIDNILSMLPQEGVTAILATTTTGSEEAILKALMSISTHESQEGTEILGIHLEGPYLSKGAPGAHSKELIISPDLASFQRFQAAARGSIKMVTLAPEEDENHQLIRHLVQQKITPSMGHSVATYDQAEDAFKSGCSCVTHCYNAMSGLHHRDPGVVGAALLMDGLKVEIIADHIHVSRPAIQVLDQMKVDDDLILVTDAMRAKGLPAGEYEICGQSVYSDGSEVRSGNGALAGSVLRCDQALRNYMEITGKTLVQTVKMLTETPARLHGVYDRKGSLDSGKDADIVILDSDLQVYMTVCRGKAVYLRHHENNSCR